MTPMQNSEAIASQATVLFNHDIMNCTNENVVGNTLYSGRALGISRPDDLIQLHPDLHSEFPHIEQHYRRIGLPHSEHIIWDVSLSELGRHPDCTPSVFFFGDDTYRQLRDDHWSEAVRSINSKNKFVWLCTMLGVPTPETYCFNDKREITDLNAMPYPCYVKAAVSVAGKGIYRCAEAQEMYEVLSIFPHSIPMQVQQEIDSRCFLNVQYNIQQGQLERLAVTEQLLDGFSHMGNRYPSGYEPWSITDPLAQWLLHKGMRGVFAFDVAVIEGPEQPSFLAIECNPRFNGATYPTLIAKRLNIPAWQAIVLDSRHRSLTDIDLSGLEYDPATSEGLVVFNWGSILAGKLGVLAAGDETMQEALLKALRERL